MKKQLIVMSLILIICLPFVIAPTSVFAEQYFMSTKKIVDQRGGKVKVVKYEDGTWQLLVEDKPYFIKGVMFTPVKIGESPDAGTMRDWMYYDHDKDGRNDIAFQTWIDKNRNSKKDSSEKEIGDFQLLKEMGVNTIRLYHVASDNHILGDIYKTNPSTGIQFDHPVNKELLRKLYNDYGIMVIMGNFLGAWTIGSGATWEQGTDYTNPEHCENIKKSVRAMVLDNKDEPYVLMWELGNENNLGKWLKCNAAIELKAYATLIGELAKMIHELDPNHPVSVCDGDSMNALRRYAEFAKEVDVISYNSYRGKYGFGTLWKSVKATLDRPVFISEYGIFAYDSKVGEDDSFQLEYLKGCWKDIVRQSSENFNPQEKLVGNSIGAVVFDWLDRWYMDGTPETHNPGNRPWDSPDGLRHEEWFGLVSMGNGSNTLIRQKRKAYNYFKEVWNKQKLSF